MEKKPKKIEIQPNQPDMPEVFPPSPPEIVPYENEIYPENPNQELNE